MEPAGPVRVWVGRADAVAPGDPLLAALTADERARAARFVHARDARAFSVARAVRRVVVARAVGRDPADVGFAIGEHGKPRLVRLDGDPDVRFNVSHSGDLVALAVAVGRDVGVDVEERRILPDLDSVAERSFSPGERAAVLAHAHPAMRHRAFFACWSRKEAVIKAIGLGLAFPLDAFDVDVDPDAAPPRLLASRDPRLAVARWSMRAFPVPGDYASALVVERRPPSPPSPSPEEESGEDEDGAPIIRCVWPPEG